MTREEEIKARLDNGDYMDPGKFLDQAPDDIRYILARNEELQRRVEKTEEALRECQTLFQNIRDYGAMGSPSDYVKVQYAWSRVNSALDAKEQDDD